MVLSKFSKRSLVICVAIASTLIAVPAFAADGDGGGSGGASSVETMVSDLSTVADDAFPIATGVTGFAVAALLIKRVLYA